MRVTTLVILTVLALGFPGWIRNAIAADNSKTLTEQLQESGLLAPLAPTAPAAPSDNSRPVAPSDNSRRELFSEPFHPGVNSDTNSRRELFSEPFYAGDKQPVKKEKLLSQGSEGPEVAAVQKRLQAHGFDPGAIDSVFGSRTATAVIAFQQVQGLKADGKVNEKTWNALAQEPMRPVPTVPTVPNAPQAQKSPINTLAKGATGSKVKTLQVRLETQGYAPGPIDGIFGSRTMAAVQEFQTAEGLKADGVVDEITWAALSKN